MSSKYKTLSDISSDQKSHFIHDLEAGNFILETLNKLLQDLFNAAEDEAIDDEKRELLDSCINDIQSVSWSFPVKIEVRRFSDLDRTKSLLASPLFTSKIHPWPKYDDRFRQPIMQYYLEDLSRWMKVDCGEGLVQLWAGPYVDDGNEESCLVRVIPTQDVKTEYVSPIPSEILSDYFSSHEFSAGGEGIWPECSDNCNVFEIAGVQEKSLTWSGRLNFSYISKILNEDLNLSKNIDDLVNLFTTIRPHRSNCFIGEWFVFDGHDPHVWPNHGYVRLVKSREIFTLIHDDNDDML